MVVVCPKCHFPQTIYEKKAARQDLRTKVSFFYENVTCARNMFREYFNTTRKDKSSSINKTSVIALHSIGKSCFYFTKSFSNRASTTLFFLQRQIRVGKLAICKKHKTKCLSKVVS